MAKTLLDFTPSDLAALKGSQLVYLVDPALGRAGDIVVSLDTLKEFLGVSTGGGTTEPPPPPPPPPPGTVATPTFSPAAGNNTGPISVTISCDTSGATIRYTLDGSTPSETSTLYAGAISLSSNTTVKAIATKSGMTNSAVNSAAYTFSSGGGGTTGGSNPTGFINLYGVDRAEYPREYITSRMPVRTGALITVAAGGNVQAALDAAQPGDWVVLEAGATFVGNFTLPLRNGDTLSGGNNVIVVTTSAFASLPEKVRVTSATSNALFATLKTADTSNLEALKATQATSGWRLVGITFAVDAAVTELTRLVAMGSISSVDQPTVASAPKNIIIDRCRFDGHSTLNLRRAITFEVVHGAVINSWFGDDIHYAGADSQSILSGNTPGPLKFVNNRIQGTTEGIMFGGFQAACGMVSDVEVRYNLFTRPLAWRGVTSWSVKNMFEIKKARRVLLEGNIFENHWAESQAGYPVLIKHEPYFDESLGQTEDIIMKNNIIRIAPGGYNCTTNPENNGGSTTTYLRRVVQLNNLYYDISEPGNQNDCAYLSQGVTKDCVHSHCTYVSTDKALTQITLAPTERTLFKDMIFTNSQYGVKGDSTQAGNATLATYGGTLSKTVLVFDDPGSAVPLYPSDCYFVGSVAAIGFTNVAAKNYLLTSASLYKNQASDGTDPGADIAAVNGATAFATSGDTTTIQT